MFSGSIESKYFTKYILCGVMTIGDEGMKLLKEGLKVDQFEEIQLDNNEIGDEGVKHLAEGLTGNTGNAPLEDNDIVEGGELLSEVYDLNFT